MEEIRSYALASRPEKNRHYICPSYEIITNFDEKNPVLEKHEIVKQVLQISFYLLDRRDKELSVYKIALITSLEYVEKVNDEVKEKTYVDMIDVEVNHKTCELKCCGYDPIVIADYFKKNISEYKELLKNRPKIEPFIMRRTNWQTLRNDQARKYHEFTPLMTTPEYKAFYAESEKNKIVGADNIPEDAVEPVNISVSNESKNEKESKDESKNEKESKDESKNEKESKDESKNNDVLMSEITKLEDSQGESSPRQDANSTAVVLHKSSIEPYGTKRQEVTAAEIDLIHDMFNKVQR